MLTNLSFQNFKSWRDTGDIRFARITGFFGTNSSGKTSILQFLLMLKQTVESNDLQNVLHTGNDRTYVDLGTSNNWIHKGKIPNRLSFSLSWKPRSYVQLPVDRGPSYQPISSRFSIDYYYNSKIKLNASVAVENNDIIVSTMSYVSNTPENEVGIGLKARRKSGEEQENYELFCRDDLTVKFIDSKKENWQINTAILLQRLRPKKFYGFSNQPVINQLSLQPYLSSLVSNFEKRMERVFYLGPLREYPQRLYLWSGESPQDVGKRGELAIPALLRGRRDGLDVELKVAEWLQKLELVHSFEVEAIAEHRREYEVLVRRVANSTPVTITDVGFGVSQILPVLVLCYYVPKGSIVILEQPEIHLHPSVQAGLADVLIEVSKERDLQIVLESHSEHLLRRLQRRIAEAETITNEDAALYFCEMLDKGESKLNPLEVDPFGNITNWPENFFGDEMGDLLAMNEAAMRRQGAETAE